MDTDTLLEQADQLTIRFFDWITSPAFYAQIGFVIIAIILAYSFAVFLRRNAIILREAPSAGPLLFVRSWVYQIRDLLFPLFVVIFLSISIQLSTLYVQDSLVVRVSEGLAVVPNTPATDLTGHPSISIPCGEVENLPVGLMLVGRHFEEKLVYKAAYAFEQSESNFN
jgi:hypothetical protein